MTEEFVKVTTKRFEQGIDAIGPACTGVILNGVRYGAELARREMLRRYFPARRVNVQDQVDGAPPQTLSRSPITISHRGTVSTVIVRSYWTVARSGPISQAYEKFGLPDQLKRQGLWIGPTPPGKKGYQSRDGLVFKAFGRHLKLAIWARQRQRGYQLQRHTVLFSSVDARRYLTTDPAVRAVRPWLLSSLVEEARRAI